MGVEIYEIMHMDRRVARIDTSGRCKIYYRSFLPYNLYLEEETDIDTLVNTIAANHVDQIQLAMGKSIAGYNFDHGHYSPGFARMIRKKLDENDIHVAAALRFLSWSS